MEHRKDYVKKKCNGILYSEIEAHPVRNKEFLINDKYHLAWCNIFKSASTTWLYNFLKLKGFSGEAIKKTKKKVIELARTEDTYPRPSLVKLREVLSNDAYLSFIIVRDPFERLLSAYCDKIENVRDNFYDKVRCEMNEETCRPSFGEFVDFITGESILGNSLDEHWTPYFSFCSPCIVSYDVIMKFETLIEDEQQLFDKVCILQS